jgi:hypothetical protein
MAYCGGSIVHMYYVRLINDRYDIYVSRLELEIKLTLIYTMYVQFFERYFKTCPLAKALKFENLTIKTGQALKFEI